MTLRDPAHIQALRRHPEFLILAEEVLDLRPAGREHEYVALCPFHEDTSPSLTLNAATGLWNCYGCEAGGNVIDWVMQIYDLSFNDACSLLEQRLGSHSLSPARAASRPSSTPKALSTDPRLLSLLTRATGFYAHNLADEKYGRAGRRYLKSRGVTDATVSTFELGLAGIPGRDLVSHALRSGVSADELRQVGLSAEVNGTTVDHFRSLRLMFPVQDTHGVVRGFGSRSLDDATGAKYINSPSCDVFQKGALLYGLPRAVAPAKAAGRLILVEGFFDVLLAHQHGWPETVSPMGTALTVAQADLLASLRLPVAIAYDSDSGGLNSLPQVTERLLGAGVPKVSLLSLPAPHDPASLLSAGRRDLWAAALSAAHPA